MRRSVDGRRNRRQPVRQRPGGHPSDRALPPADGTGRRHDLNGSRHTGPDTSRKTRRNPQDGLTGMTFRFADFRYHRPDRQMVTRRHMQRRDFPRDLAHDPLTRGTPRLQLQQRYPARSKQGTRDVRVPLALSDLRLQQFQTVLEGRDLAFQLGCALPGDPVSGRDPVTRTNDEMDEMPGLGRHHVLAKPGLQHDAVDRDAARDVPEERPGHERREEESRNGQDHAFVRRRHPQQAVEVLLLSPRGFPAKRAVEHARRSHHSTASGPAPTMTASVARL